MRKPEDKEKFKAAIEAMIAFYGRRDKKMVYEVLIRAAEKAKKHIERGATGAGRQTTDARPETESEQSEDDQTQQDPPQQNP